MRRLPPLNAIKAFEATARHLSFTKAARELCVTQGAVSRHVAALEDELGAKLFARHHRTIELTPKGEIYFRALRDAFDRIQDATEHVAGASDTPTLRLKLPPTFAIRWIVPRLARLHAIDRSFDVQITTSHSPVDFDREEIDVAIHSGDEPQPGTISTRLFGEVLTPVCSPALLRQGRSLTNPGDLKRHTLLCSLHRPHDWPTWIEAAGVTASTAIAASNSRIRASPTRPRSTSSAWRWRRPCWWPTIWRADGWSRPSSCRCRRAAPISWSTPRARAISRRSGASRNGFSRNAPPRRRSRARPPDARTGSPMTEPSYGVSRTRREDARLLLGQGRFTADLQPEGLCHAVFVRSPHGHARVARIDTAAAAASPGVIAVLTAADLAADGIGPILSTVELKRPDGTPARPRRARCLSAMSCAILASRSPSSLPRRRMDALDAGELVEVDYDPLPAVTSCREALAPDAPAVWAEAADNIAFLWRHGDHACGRQGHRRRPRMSRGSSTACRGWRPCRWSRA